MRGNCFQAVPPHNFGRVHEQQASATGELGFCVARCESRCKVAIEDGHDLLQCIAKTGKCLDRAVRRWWQEAPARDAHSVEVREASRASHRPGIAASCLHQRTRPEKPDCREHYLRWNCTRASRIATEGTSRESQILREGIDPAIVRDGRRCSTEQLSQRRRLHCLQRLAVESELQRQRARHAVEDERKLRGRRCDEHSGASTSSCKDRCPPRGRRSAEKYDPSTEACPRAFSNQRRGGQAVVILYREDDYVRRVLSKRRENVRATLDSLERDGRAYRLSQQRRLRRIAEECTEHAQHSWSTSGLVSTTHDSLRRARSIRQHEIRSAGSVSPLHGGQSMEQIGQCAPLLLREGKAHVSSETLVFIDGP